MEQSAPAQRLTIEQYESLRPTLWIDAEGKRIYFNVPNTTAAWRVQSLSGKEPATLNWLGAMRSGEILFDIGANVGMYAVMAAACRGVRVFAFEPESQNYALLNANIEINKLSDLVTAFPAAVMDRQKLDVLYLSDFKVGGSCHSFGSEVGFDLKVRPSPFRQGAISVTIDDIVASGAAPVPNHIKIDVDGFEHLVLAGARNTLTRPELQSLLIELNTNLPEHNAVFDLLAEYGFEYDSRQMEQALRREGPFKGVGEVVFLRAERPTATVPPQAGETAKSTPPSMPTYGRRLRINLPRGEEANAVLNHILGRLEAATVIRDPFPYAVIDGIFPDAYFRRLLDNFPDPDVFVPIDELGRVSKGAYKERSVVELETDGFNRIPTQLRGFWEDFGSVLSSDLFISSFIGKFADALEYRFRRICANGVPLQVRSDTLLVRDHTDYEIAPHTDAPHRLISFLFYMPEDDKLRAYGTSLYKPKDPNFTCWGDRHHTFEPFTKVGMIEFLPNRLFVFPKTERTFHGVEQIKEEGIRRNLVISNIRVMNAITH